MAEHTIETAVKVYLDWSVEERRWVVSHTTMDGHPLDEPDDQPGVQCEHESAEDQAECQRALAELSGVDAPTGRELIGMLAAADEDGSGRPSPGLDFDVLVGAVLDSRYQWIRAGDGLDMALRTAAYLVERGAATITADGEPLDVYRPLGFMRDVAHDRGLLTDVRQDDPSLAMPRIPSGPAHDQHLSPSATPALTVARARLVEEAHAVVRRFDEDDPRDTPQPVQRLARALGGVERELDAAPAKPSGGDVRRAADELLCELGALRIGLPGAVEAAEQVLRDALAAAKDGDADELLLVRDTERVSGRPTIGHSRLPASTILRRLAAEPSFAAVQAAYPGVTTEQLGVLSKLLEELLNERSDDPPRPPELELIRLRAMERQYVDAMRRLVGLPHWHAIPESWPTTKDGFLALTDVVDLLCEHLGPNSVGAPVGAVPGHEPTVERPWTVTLAYAPGQHAGRVTVEQTRGPVDVIVGMLRAGEPPKVVAVEHGLPMEPVRVLDVLRGELDAASAPEEPEDGPAFFAAAMAEHGRCSCGPYDAVPCNPGTAACALCNVLPEGWPCPTVEHEGYAKPDGRCVRCGEVVELAPGGTLMMHAGGGSLVCDGSGTRDHEPPAVTAEGVREPVTEPHRTTAPVLPGPLMAAWRQIVELIDPTGGFLSPASIVDRVAVLVERDRAEPDGDTAHGIARSLVRLAPPGDRAEVVEQLARLPILAAMLDEPEDPDGDGHPTIREWAQQPAPAAAEPGEPAPFVPRLADGRAAAGIKVSTAGTHKSELTVRGPVDGQCRYCPADTWVREDGYRQCIECGWTDSPSALPDALHRLDAVRAAGAELAEAARALPPQIADARTSSRLDRAAQRWTEVSG